MQLLLGMLLGSVLGLVFPFLTQALVDSGIINQDLGFIYTVLLAQLMLFLGRTSIDIIRGFAMLSWPVWKRSCSSPVSRWAAGSWPNMPTWPTGRRRARWSAG